MAREERYFQCSISQGTKRDVSYIEERGAFKGAQIELGSWGTGDFWNVDDVSSKFLFKHQLKSIQDDHHKGYASIR